MTTADISCSLKIKNNPVWVDHPVNLKSLSNESCSSFGKPAGELSAASTNNDPS